MHVRVCRECGEEYRPDIAVCADCGGELLDRHEDEQGRPLPGLDGAAPADPAEPAMLVRPLFSGSVASIKLLADALVVAGVPFHLVPESQLMRGRTDPTKVVLGVTETDFERAQKVLAPFSGRNAELGLHEFAAVWTNDAPAADADVTCPACGAGATAGATACPECGLDWGGQEGAPAPHQDDD